MHRSVSAHRFSSAKPSLQTPAAIITFASRSRRLRALKSPRASGGSAKRSRRCAREADRAAPFELVSPPRPCELALANPTRSLPHGRERVHARADASRAGGAEVRGVCGALSRFLFARARLCRRRRARMEGAWLQLAGGAPAAARRGGGRAVRRRAAARPRIVALVAGRRRLYRRRD